MYLQKQFPEWKALICYQTLTEISEKFKIAI